MTYIKRMTMQGFKSFARKTEIPLEDSMNVIVGPNGSGKSNITDALCFVLGRLSIKSIRAAKAANLLFSGNKVYKASPEASVELAFDNSKNTFAVEEKEVLIKRIVRKNGNSIYKINGVTKTRQDLLELLSQAGIDPNGFNIVLQGEIQSLVKSTSEERRKIIEEVAGISIYTTRKNKSLKELEKAEEKLSEVSAVLRERNAYLKNLDKERSDAESFQKLEETVKRCKVTILDKNLKENEKELWGIQKIIDNHKKEIEKVKVQVEDKNNNLGDLQEEIVLINKKIQTSTTIEQEVLHKEIADLRANLAGLNVRFENFETRIESGKKRTEDHKEKIKVLEKEVSNIKTNTPEIKNQQKEQKKIQEKLEILEEKRRRFYILRSDLATLEGKRIQKEQKAIESKKELEILSRTIASLHNELKYAKSIESSVKQKEQTKEKIRECTNNIAALEGEIRESEKENAVLLDSIKRQDRLKNDITSIDLCPVCKQNVGENHKHEISSKSEEKVSVAKKRIEKNINLHTINSGKIASLKKELSDNQSKANELEIDRIKLKSASDRQDQIKRIQELGEETKKDLAKILQKISTEKKEFESLKGIEEEYDEARLQIQEIGFTDMDVDAEVAMKSREINRLQVESKASLRDVEESRSELKSVSAKIEEKENILEKKEVAEQELYEKFQVLFGKRNEFQDKQKAIETDLIGLQHTQRNFEEKINHSKITKAQLEARLDSLKTEIAEFGSLEIISGSMDQIKERLQKSQFRISKIGNVNLRALEVFDKVKEQVAQIEEKVGMIGKEKDQIEKIIEEIDKKKKKSFMVTLNTVNEHFSRNFSQLSRKGSVTLELEDKKDPFSAGLNILVKVSRGRYFDVTSLSGGEKTMVALSLIFAIQEYKPYSFYVFDEIDAALDKHNSELLAALIKKYMTSGQYIIITHNDTLIGEASNIYGVSMQENISKIISLKV